jgi:hypothetical protein
MTARRHGGSVTITPFWNRFPRFFLYPLTPPGLYVLLGLAILNAALLDGGGSLGGGLVVGVSSLVASLFSIKYGYDILEKTANGDLMPPRLNREILIEGYELPFKQLAVFIVIGVVIAALAQIFPLGLIPFGVIVALLLPAMIMTLALERSVAAALNPATLFGIALRVGWPYLAVLGLLLLLNGGAGTAMALFGQNLPGSARAFFGAFTQNLFGFAMMHLMGYLIYQYHDRVGFVPAAVIEADDGWGEVLQPIHEALEAGNPASAAQQLKALIRSYPDHAIDLRLRRHQALKLSDQEDALIDNGGELLGALIDANRLREAAEVYLDLTARDPELRPARAGDYEPMMTMLVQRGEYQRAVRMANGFHKAFPNSEATPPLYLEVARVFLEHLQQPARARQITDFLLHRYPEHPLAHRARAMREAATA